MTLWMLFVVLYATAAAVSLWSRAQVVGFVNDTLEIAGTSDLERFKALARMEMYLALVMIVLLLSGLATGILLIFRHGLLGLLGVVLANAVVLGLGALHKGVEDRARKLPATDGLEAEYRRVGQIWTRKALPDF
jgi:hypothetical protein